MKIILLIILFLFLSCPVLAGGVVVENTILSRPNVLYSCRTNNECNIILNKTSKCFDGMCYIVLEDYHEPKQIQLFSVSDGALLLLIAGSFVILLTKENEIRDSLESYGILEGRGKIKGFNTESASKKLFGIKIRKKEYDYKVQGIIIKRRYSLKDRVKNFLRLKL